MNENRQEFAHVVYASEASFKLRESAKSELFRPQTRDLSRKVNRDGVIDLILLAFAR